jgi:hypothetical protein
VFLREIDGSDVGGGRDSAPAVFLRRSRRPLAGLAAAAPLLLVFACRPAVAPTANSISKPGAAAPAPAPAAYGEFDARQQAVLDVLERRTFDFFWELTNPKNGLVPDRAPAPSFSSIAAVGFGLTAYPIGVERGYVGRDEAIARVLTTLRFFSGPSPPRAAGERGFFYHFLDMKTGSRFEKVELSTIDTTLFLAGALFCESYFDRDDPGEAEIRALAERLYADADWKWLQVRPPLISHGWSPEEGFNTYDWKGYDEAMILYVLALASPAHSVEPEAWREWTRTYRWATFYGQDYVAFVPLFGYQYSHIWIDFAGIQDAYMREKGIDYFENSRRATLAQHAYAIENPEGWRDYGENIWGLTACDGPIDATFPIDGRQRRFHTYWARGVAPGDRRDDGTLAPTAAIGSLPFAPEIVLPAIAELQHRYGEKIFSRYGFFDAFNPTFRLGVPLQHGRVIDGVGWVDGDYLGIDQGPIIAMIENYRTGLVWKYMRNNLHIVTGLRRAGFTGGWLDSSPN